MSSPGNSPSSATGQLVLTAVSFEDADHHGEWAKQLGGDVDFMQLSPGPNEIRYDHFALPELVVGHYARKQAMKDVCAVPAGMIVLLISRAKRPFVWNGREFPPTLMVNGDVDELRVSGEVFAASLRAAGRPVDVVTEAGTDHGHLNRPHEPAASVTLDRFAARLASLANLAPALHPTAPQSPSAPANAAEPQVLTAEATTDRP